MKKESKKDEYAYMRFRSTGLGKTELLCELKKCDSVVEVVNDMLLIHVQSVKPVRWHIRAGLSYKVLMKAIWKIAKQPALYKFLILGIFHMFNPRMPDEF